MPGVCILTDSTAQFPATPFAGQELVKVLPLRIRLDGTRLPESKDLRLSDLPRSAPVAAAPLAQPPSREEFLQEFLALGNDYPEVIAILLSENLNPMVHHARAAAASLGAVSITVIDSQTTGVGLGLLVQAAAEALQQGASVAEIRSQMRRLVAQVYTLFCVQSLTYLAQGGHLDAAQAVVGEMLGVTALFVLEGGRLVPIQKPRSSRHLLDLLYEFVLEFGKLRHVALFKGVIPFENETRALRERITAELSATPYSEMVMSAALAAILGPRSLGLVAMEE